MMKRFFSILIFLRCAFLAFAAYPRIPDYFISLTGEKIFPDQYRMIIWSYDYSGYAVTCNNGTFKEYFMFCDTTRRNIHIGLIREFKYQNNKIKESARTLWARQMPSLVFREYAYSLNSFFRDVDINTSCPIDTLYRDICCINFSPHWIAMYNNRDSLLFCLSDDEFGFTTNSLLSNILQAIYTYYDFEYYWAQEHYSYERGYRTNTSQKLKKWFLKNTQYIIDY